MRILKLCVGGFLGAALLQGSFAISAPAISSVAGSPADGQAVTITGSGFGTRSQPGPLVFDDFESGSPVLDRKSVV